MWQNCPRRQHVCMYATIHVCMYVWYVTHPDGLPSPDMWQNCPRRQHVCMYVCICHAPWRAAKSRCVTKLSRRASKAFHNAARSIAWVVTSRLAKNVGAGSCFVYTHVRQSCMILWLYLLALAKAVGAGSCFVYTHVCDSYVWFYYCIFLAHTECGCWKLCCIRMCVSHV
jgi:hypothetical protein